MHILIIGGAGYIGGVTARIAVDYGHHVTIFDNLSTGLAKNVPQEAYFIKGDLLVPSDLITLFKDGQYDVVLHFAAKILVNESMEHPYEYLHTNSFGLLEAVEEATRSGVQNYILSSTAAVYGIPVTNPIDEGAAMLPINPYGESKLIAEHILAGYAQSKSMNWLALRYFNVAGAYKGVGPDYPFISHVIPALLNGARKSASFTINGNDYATDDGTCVRDFVHVYDIGLAHVLAAERIFAGEKFNTAINLGSSTGYSVKDIVEAFQKVTQKKLTIRFAPRREGDPDMLVASNAKANQLLGWIPKKSIDDILRDHTEWYDKLPLNARAKSL